MRLSTLHQLLTRDEREALAKAANTDVGYLWQLATQWRGKKPSLEMIQTLAAADSRLTVAELFEEFTGDKSEGAPSLPTKEVTNA